MSRWRCARWCCQPFSQATDHQPFHLCHKTGKVDPYVPDTQPTAAPSMPALQVKPILRAVA